MAKVHSCWVAAWEETLLGKQVTDLKSSLSVGSQKKLKGEGFQCPVSAKRPGPALLSKLHLLLPFLFHSLLHPVVWVWQASLTQVTEGSKVALPWERQRQVIAVPTKLGSLTALEHDMYTLSPRFLVWVERSWLFGIKYLGKAQVCFLEDFLEVSGSRQEGRSLIMTRVIYYDLWVSGTTFTPAEDPPQAKK